MTPLKQRFRHRPEEGIWGDCHRAAIASVLDLQLDDVPHFGDGGPDDEEFRRRTAAFFAARGMREINAPYRASLSEVLEAVVAHNGDDVEYLLGGTSRTGVGHTVVCRGDKIVHDPSLDESGIVGPMNDGFYWVTYFGVALPAAKGV